MRSLGLRSLSLVLAVTVATVALPAVASARPRVGFVNLAKDADAGQQRIEVLRKAVVDGGAHAVVDDAALRAALEAPATPGAPDADPVVRTRELLQKGREALAAGEPDAAFSRLRAARQALDGAGPSTAALTLLSELDLTTGLLYLAQNDQARALESLRLSARLSPERRALDSREFPAPAVALYARALEVEAAATRDAKLSVTTQPAGATVWIDGKPVGPAPVEQAVSAGAHHVIAVAEGFAPRAEDLRASTGASGPVELLLARLDRADELHALRSRLAATPTPTAAARLTRLASSDALVLVRQQANGQLEAAVFATSGGQLSAFGAAEPGVVLAALPSGQTGDAIAVSQPSALDLRVHADEKTELPRESKPWYRTWWGTVGMIGAGVLVTGVVLSLTVPD